MKLITDLTPAELDYYVGKAEGIDPLRLAIRKATRGDELICVLDMGTPNETRYSPSTNIVLGWLIIGEAKIGMEYSTYWNNWSARIDIGNNDIFFHHTDRLIAAMQCYVKSKFDNEVPEIEVSK